jgi:hypothetical protein
MTRSYWANNGTEDNRISAERAASIAPIMNESLLPREPAEAHLR